MANSRICSVDGCSKPHKANSFCSMHERRWKLYGDPCGGKAPFYGMQTTCSIEGCGRLFYARGWCESHYRRWRKYGDPFAGQTVRGDATRFYHEVVLRYDGDECLIWPFSRTPSGYARMGIGRKICRVSRVLCEEVNGPPPTPEHEAAHSCGGGTRGCVNPRHLRWATKLENAADRVKHGTTLRGERAARSKLTRENVREIRSLKGRETQRELSRRFGVSTRTVYDIQARNVWAWLD